MLNTGKVSPEFWHDAVIYSSYLRNYIYNPALKNSPAYIIGYRPIDCKYLHIFGEKCAVTIPPYDGEKLETRAHIGMYLGYDEDTYGHIIYIPEIPGDLSEGFFEYTRHVQFFPNTPLYMMSFQDTTDTIDISPTDDYNFLHDFIIDDSNFHTDDEMNKLDNTMELEDEEREDSAKGNSIDSINHNEDTAEMSQDEIISIHSLDSDIESDHSNYKSGFTTHSDTSPEDHDSSENIPVPPSKTGTSTENELIITPSISQDPSNDAPLIKIQLDEHYDTDIEKSFDAGAREPEQPSHSDIDYTETEENIIHKEEAEEDAKEDAKEESEGVLVVK